MFRETILRGKATMHLYICQYCNQTGKIQIILRVNLKSKVDLNKNVSRFFFVVKIPLFIYIFF